jgi:dipeptidyl aminopeptidase/acylaminoacyl peptidase
MPTSAPSATADSTAMITPPSATTTPDPPKRCSVEYLRQGTYGGGEVEILERVAPVARIRTEAHIPFRYMNDIRTAVSIHHGLEDKLGPVQWSMQTCELRKATSIEVECAYYEVMPHTFRGQGDAEFIRFAIEFMTRHLTAP